MDMQSSRKKQLCPLRRVLCVAPRLVLVAVIEFLAEPADVGAELIEILLLDLARLLVEVREFLFGKPFLCRANVFSVVIQAEIRCF